MAGLGLLALAHAARHGVRRNGPDARSAAGHAMVLQIEAEYRDWWAIVGRHPADDAAERCITRLRDSAGSPLLPRSMPRRTSGGRP